MPMDNINTEKLSLKFKMSLVCCFALNTECVRIYSFLQFPLSQDGEHLQQWLEPWSFPPWEEVWIFARSSGQPVTSSLTSHILRPQTSTGQETNEYLLVLYNTIYSIRIYSTCTQIMNLFFFCDFIDHRLIILAKSPFRHSFEQMQDKNQRQILNKHNKKFW